MTTLTPTMSAVAHNIEEKIRTDDVQISESVDFSGLLLSQPVLDGLSKAGFKRPSPIQLKAIPLGRCGLDLIVQAKSGTGKTCVFTVIALEGLDLSTDATQVLILAPTREIAIQINSVVSSIGACMPGLKSHSFIGGTVLSQDKISAKHCHIATGTPGRIKQLIELEVLKTASIRLFVLDEADKLLDGGFTESINWIYSSLPDNKQVVALSATYPEVLAQHLTRYMRNPTFVRLNITDPALIGIKQYHAIVPDHPLPNKVFDAKTEVVVKILSSVSFQQCLIFSNLQTRAQNLQSELQSRNWPTECIAGCLDQKDRSQAIAQLKAYKCRILISTDLTSRGVDADKVNMVINLDVPKDFETYLHRIGRAGRFGSHGAAITIVSKGQQEKELWAVERKCKTHIPKLPNPIPSNLATKFVAINLSDVVTTETIITCTDPMYEQSALSNRSEDQDIYFHDVNDNGDQRVDTVNDSHWKEKHSSPECIISSESGGNLQLFKLGKDDNKEADHEIPIIQTCYNKSLALKVCEDNFDEKGEGGSEIIFSEDIKDGCVSFCRNMELSDVSASELVVLQDYSELCSVCLLEMRPDDKHGVKCQCHKDKDDTGDGCQKKKIAEGENVKCSQDENIWDGTGSRSNGRMIESGKRSISAVGVMESSKGGNLANVVASSITQSTVHSDKNGNPSETKKVVSCEVHNGDHSLVKTVQMVLDREGSQVGGDSEVVGNLSTNVEPMTDMASLCPAKKSNQTTPQLLNNQFPKPVQKTFNTQTQRRQKHPKSFELSSFLRGLTEPCMTACDIEDKSTDSQTDNLTAKGDDLHCVGLAGPDDGDGNREDLSTSHANNIGHNTQLLRIESLRSHDSPQLNAAVNNYQANDFKSSEITTAYVTSSALIDEFAPLDTLNDLDPDINILSCQKDCIDSQVHEIEVLKDTASDQPNLQNTQLLVCENQCALSNTAESSKPNHTGYKLAQDCSLFTAKGDLNFMTFSELVTDFKIECKKNTNELNLKEISETLITRLSDKLDSLHTNKGPVEFVNGGCCRVMDVRREIKARTGMVKSERRENPEIVKDFLATVPKSWRSNNELGAREKEKQQTWNTKMKRKRVNGNVTNVVRGSDAPNWRRRENSDSDCRVRKMNDKEESSSLRNASGLGGEKSFDDLLKEQLQLKGKREENVETVTNKDDVSVEGKSTQNDEPTKQNFNLNPEPGRELTSNIDGSNESPICRVPSRVDRRKPDEECQMLDKMHQDMLKRRKERKEQIAALKQEAAASSQTEKLSNNVTAVEGILPTENGNNVKLSGVDLNESKGSASVDLYVIKASNVPKQRNTENSDRNKKDIISQEDGLFNEVPPVTDKAKSFENLLQERLSKIRGERREAVEKMNKAFVNGVNIETPDVVENNDDCLINPQVPYIYEIVKKYPKILEKTQNKHEKTQVLHCEDWKVLSRESQEVLHFALNGPQLTDSDELSLSSDSDISDIDSDDENTDQKVVSSRFLLHRSEECLPSQNSNIEDLTRSSSRGHCKPTLLAKKTLSKSHCSYEHMDDVRSSGHSALPLRNAGTKLTRDKSHQANKYPARLGFDYSNNKTKFEKLGNENRKQKKSSRVPPSLILCHADKKTSQNTPPVDWES